MNSDFLNSTDYPLIEPDFDIEGPDRFFNRELSWLSFNWRVLEEAQNPNVPLFERINFLSISGSNLDEFYSVRVAGLLGQARAGVARVSADGLTAVEQLQKIDEDARRLMDEQQNCWRELRTLLLKEKREVLSHSDLSKVDIERLETYFMEQVFPVLTPLAIDPAHPFPFIPNKGFALALNLSHVKTGKQMQALLPIPAQVDRFIDVEGGRSTNKRILPLEDLLLAFLPRLFPGYKTDGHCVIRVLRDSDLEVEEEAEDLVREFESALKRRRRGRVIRLKISKEAPKTLFDLIIDEMDVASSEIIEIDGVIGISDLKELVSSDRPDLQWVPFAPRVPERVQDFDGDIFAAIKHKDMLLHHPYETFDIVVRFLQQAANDPNVVAIKQTLYRTSSESPIVEALAEAAENGKSVTALIELKARFDEAANIRQSRRLERAGAQVVYGFIDWKTHAKVSTVVRREGAHLVTYSHFGTGNYHPITAKFYTDLSLFTCVPEFGRDAAKLFNYVSGYAKPEAMEKVKLSPHELKSHILNCLEDEIAHAKAGRPAHVWIKVNSVIEPIVIDGLYKASQAGVKIDIVARGICGVRPGIKGLSENIRVKSIIGRFLEHSRIVCFGNGHGLPSKEAKVYISSADWMGRNLNRRIETLVAVENPTVHSQIVDQIMAANFADTAQSWVLTGDGKFQRYHAKDQSKAFNCHKYFMETPSLSGRGKRANIDVPKLKHSK